MSKHGRCVICREFPFIHYYSEGWAQLSASHVCAQHGSLCAQRGPTKPLSLTLLSPSPALPWPPPSYTPSSSFSSSPPPGQTPDRFIQLTFTLWDLPLLQCQFESCQPTYANLINPKEKKCAWEGKEWGNVKGGGLVGKDEGVVPFSCSLGNSSNLESCQDIARLCEALPFPHPCVPMLADEWTSKKNNNIERNRKRSRVRGCQCLMLFVYIQGKLTLCVDRISYHLIGFLLSSTETWIWGVRAFPLSCLATAQHLTPCFLNCCQSMSNPLFLCQICTDSFGTASFEHPGCL